MYMVTDIAGPPLDIPEPPTPKPPAAAEGRRCQPPPPPVERPAPKPDVAKYLRSQDRGAQAEASAGRGRTSEGQRHVPAVETGDGLEPAGPPREPVKTGLMTGGSSAVPTIEASPLDKVQTGGFGDPNGVAGPSDPNKRANIGQFGNPALASGPRIRQWYGRRKRRERNCCQHRIWQRRGDSALRRRTANRNRAGRRFRQPERSGRRGPKKKADDAPAVEPVVILAKPRPVYSAEALKLNLEGEVLLEVVFPASGGEVQVNRVVKGLGHGLDEAAMRAAEQIKYKPALSNGHPVDFPAVVHIVFQMAY